MSVIAEIREILSRGESEETWEALAQALTPYKAKKTLGTLLDEWLPYALSHLETWPADLMRRPPDEWLFRANGGRKPVKQWHPCLLLCNAIRWEGMGLANKDAAQMFSSPYLVNIQFLNVSNNMLSRSGLKEIFASPHLSSLKELNITQNHFSKGTLKDLPLLSDKPLFQKLIYKNVHYDAMDQGEEKAIQKIAADGGWEVELGEDPSLY